MRELILQSARLRLVRLALLALGAAAITAGLSYLVGTLQRSQEQVMGRMEDRWQVSYDILVRPERSAAVGDYFSPSQLAGGIGGITLGQWEQIKAMDGVAAAAPIAHVGWVDFPTGVDVPAEAGLYRAEWEQRQTDGLQTYSARGTAYTWVVSPSLILPGRVESVFGPQGVLGTFDRRNPNAIDPGLFSAAGIQIAPIQEQVPMQLQAPLPVGVVAISPADEASLIGLNNAVRDGAYFDRAHSRPVLMTAGGRAAYSLPVLVSQGPVGDFTLKVRVERVGLPQEPTAALLADLAAKGGAAALGKEAGTPVFNWESEPGRLGQLLLSRLATSQVTTPLILKLNPPTEPVQYELATSPDPARWAQAVQALPSGIATLPAGAAGTPVPLYRFSGLAEAAKHPVSFHLVGTYDPMAVTLPGNDDPSASQYRPGTARAMLDPAGKPLGQPSPLLPLAHPSAYLTAPPPLLTTIEAASDLLSSAPITMVRVKVQGASELSQDTIDRVEKVAKAIAALTGLQVDILRGASPEPVLVQFPGQNGYAEQTWIRQGQAIEMFQELRRGDVMVLGLVLLVGAVFMVATSVVHVLLRQKELSTLAAVGWRLRDLLVLVLAESGMVAVAGGLAALLFLPRWHTLQAAAVSLVLYGLGSTLATVSTGVGNPMRLMRSSGVTPIKQLAHVDSLAQMAWGSLRARRRNTLSLAALVLPTALLVVLTALTLRLEDRFFVNVLGSQVALEVGPFHYAMMVAAFALAAATTADLMSLSVLERRNELALLGALGWRKAVLRKIVLIEGLLWGLAAGAAGIVVGLGVLYVLYGRIHPGLWPLLPLTLAVPVVTGLVAAILPAESAARMQPNEGVKLS